MLNVYSVRDSIEGSFLLGIPTRGTLRCISDTEGKYKSPHLTEDVQMGQT